MPLSDTLAALALRLVHWRAVPALTFSLGQWQLGRASQKLALQSSLEQKKSLPALVNADLSALTQRDTASASALADRLVDIAGLWLPAQTVYLDNRPMNGRPGFWVLTPLRLSGTDKLVLVQRGWMARDFVDRTRLTPIQTQATEVRIQGRMAPSLPSYMPSRAPTRG